MLVWFPYSGARRGKVLDVTSATHLVPMLGGWARQDTQHDFGGPSRPHAWGWAQETFGKIYQSFLQGFVPKEEAVKFNTKLHMEKYQFKYATMFWILLSKLEIWAQDSGATGYVAKGICFSKIFEKHLVKFKFQDGPST